MNDNLAQQDAQTPSPSTGSRQATQSVGSAMPSASFAACVHPPRQAPSARRRWLEIEQAERCRRPWFEASVGAVAAQGTNAAPLHAAPRPGHDGLDCHGPSDRRNQPPWLQLQIPERARKLGPAAFLLDRAVEEMEDRLGAVKREFADAADIWTPGEGFLHPTRFKSLTRIAPPDSLEVLALPPESLDLAISALAFQFVNDLPGVLAQIRRALRPDGLLLAAMIGGDSLTELRQSFAAAEAELEGGASPHVAPLADLRDIGSLLQRAGLALPVTDVDRVVVRYDNAFALMQDLRRMGATNILFERRRRPTRRATMLRMAQVYGERFADADGRIRATFDIIWLSGWAPHESQPKPLRPGSATASLEEAVKQAPKRA